jgi:hypothetical protein
MSCIYSVPVLKTENTINAISENSLWKQFHKTEHMKDNFHSTAQGSTKGIKHHLLVDYR